MSTESNNGLNEAKDRAEKLVSYLEEKISLPEDTPKEIRPEALKGDIEEVFRTAQETLKEIKGQK